MVPTQGGVSLTFVRSLITTVIISTAFMLTIILMCKIYAY